MPAFHDLLRLFLFTHNQNGDPWKKRTSRLSDSRAYRQYETEDKRLFSGRYSACDNRHKNTDYRLFSLRAQRVMTKDFQKVERYLHQAFSEPLHE
ncbi:hypothetical protein TNCV_2525651 [Trichonephila clavipes]|nr:hypothetical protein TNCV_2525651 [Trichonephila clavipes]